MTTSPTIERPSNALALSPVHIANQGALEDRQVEVVLSLPEAGEGKDERIVKAAEKSFCEQYKGWYVVPGLSFVSGLVFTGIAASNGGEQPYKTLAWGLGGTGVLGSLHALVISGGVRRIFTPPPPRDMTEAEYDAYLNNRLRLICLMSKCTGAVALTAAVAGCIYAIAAGDSDAKMAGASGLGAAAGGGLLAHVIRSERRA